MTKRATSQKNRAELKVHWSPKKRRKQVAKRMLQTHKTFDFHRNLPLSGPPQQFIAAPERKPGLKS